MKSCCPFLLLLIVATTFSFPYLTDSNDVLLTNAVLNDEPNVSSIVWNDIPSSLFTQQDRSRRQLNIVKRSQRNANILYRYCRRSGQAPQFCLQYAVRMVFATGH